MDYTCGTPEAYSTRAEAMTAAARLGTKRPLYQIAEAIPGFSIEETADLYEAAFYRWGAADLRTRRITDAAEAGPQDIVNVITVADLGDGGVLADQMLPGGGARLRMRVNSRIRWAAYEGPLRAGVVDILRVLAHEIGHFIGHEHWPTSGPPELMEPRITDNIWTPQPTEMGVTLNWFGAAPDRPPPNPPSPPPPGRPSPCGLLRDTVKLRNALRRFAMPETLNAEQQAALDEARRRGEIPCQQICDAITRLCPQSSAVLQIGGGLCALIPILAELIPRLCPPPQR